MNKDLQLVFSDALLLAPGGGLVLVSIVSGLMMNHRLNLGHYLPAAALLSQPIMENKARRSRRNVQMRPLRTLPSMCRAVMCQDVCVCVANSSMCMLFCLCIVIRVDVGATGLSRCQDKKVECEICMMWLMMSSNHN